MENTGFFKNHADTIAIIGVNLTIAAVLIGMWCSNTSRIDATNNRMDYLYSTIIEMMKENKINNGRI